MPSLAAALTSRTNPRVKALREAFSGRSAKAGELVGIEGATLIEEAHRSGLILGTLFVRQGAEEMLRRPQLARVHAQDTLVLSPAVFDSVVDTATPQPIAATLTIPQTRDIALGAKSGTLLVLEDIQDPGNLGTLIRSAEAFGVQAILLTPRCANQWNPKVIRASAGSVFRVPLHRGGLAESLGSLRARGTHVAAAVAQSASAVPAPLARLTQPVAVMVGNEGAGLSSEALALADELVHIPCAIESLNAAIAGSLLLYEVQRQNSNLMAGQEAMVS